MHQATNINTDVKLVTVQAFGTSRNNPTPKQALRDKRECCSQEGQNEVLSYNRVDLIHELKSQYSEGELRRNPEMDYPQQYTHQYNYGSMLTSLVENNNNNGCDNEEHFRS
ncbi:unnamed protein product [Lupinus luteus]|uniref:Uncharacterized protein n=1 Tax=Lupinus luteus TaxID=3873 RepID=A0AAV1WVH5_LUPLU